MGHGETVPGGGRPAAPGEEPQGGGGRPAAPGEEPQGGGGRPAAPGEEARRVGEEPRAADGPPAAPPGPSGPSLPSRRLSGSVLSTFVVMGSTFLSRLLGFVRIAVIGAVFGASGEADVLNVVFNIPNNLRKLMAEGALSSAFIPALSTSLVRDPSQGEARRIFGGIMGFQLVVLVPLLALSVAFSLPIVNTILDFPEVERQLLSAGLFRSLIHYVLLISISALLMGTIHAHNRFLVPALTPILFSVAVIPSILLLHERMGVYSMAVGVLVGGVIQILVQLPLMRRLGYSLMPHFRFRDPLVRRVLRQWLPVVATASIFTVNQQVALFFASGLEDGSSSALTNALTFFQLPFGIFAASVTTVLFPRMSRQSAEGDLPGLKETVSFGLRYLVVLLIPSGVLLGLIGTETISVALQRGAFETRHTILAGRVLAGYCIGLFSVGAFNFLQRFFYSRDNYRVPLMAAALTVVLDIGLSLWLKETALRVVGLSVANSISFTIGLVFLLVAAYRNVEGLSVRSILVSLGKTLVAMVPAVLFILWFRSATGEWWAAGSSWRNLGRLSLVGLGSLALTGGMLVLLRVDELRRVIRRKL
jgi:putative peptidoglycan lipid II flippase